MILTSCAKVSYITEQGLGQIGLEYNDQDVDDFLNDPSVEKEFKDKVKMISQAKEYFYKYFDLEKSDIYDEVKILDQPAVTYLVIHSPQNEIRAVKTNFPIMGSFPYLGFFSKESAIEYRNQLKKDGYSTYMRPVYAYSTLNHPLWPFHDNILSSFFYFNEVQLTELIFHELVHTVFFVKNQISVNENIADFISEAMLKDYFNWTEEDLIKREDKSNKMKRLRDYIVAASKELNQKYKESDKYSEIQEVFLNSSFYPQVKKICDDNKILACWPLKGEWNNARFAAFGTYSSKQKEIEDIYKKSRLTLKAFMLKLIKLEDEYDSDDTFLKYLERKI